MLFSRGYTLLGTLLQRIPSAWSYATVLDNIVGPVGYSLEESGGFSDIDDQKFSIYGDSWMWNQWTYHGFNTTDPFTSGTPALTAPFRFVSRLSLRYHERPENLRLMGVDVEGRRPRPTPSSPRAGIRWTIPQVGGIWPLAKPLMRVFSGMHGRERDPPPAPTRRRFRRALSAYVAHSAQLGETALSSAFELQYGTRRFLEFIPASGDLAGTFDEDYLVAKSALHLEPAASTWKAYFLAEYRQRSHLGSELHMAPSETPKTNSLALFGGLAAGALKLGLTTRYFRTKHSTLRFARDWIDPDGESFSPFAPDGDHFAANLDFSVIGESLYANFNHRLLAFLPSTHSWEQPSLLRGEPYGTFQFETEDTGEIIGDHRAGIQDTLNSAHVRFSYNLYLATTYALNTSLDNNLAFLDVGLKTRAELRLWRAFTPFVSAAKTPVPVTPELTRLLDPAYLAGRSFLTRGRSGATLLQTTGGRYTRLADQLRQTNIYSLAAGFESKLATGWTFGAQGMFKATKNTYRLELDGNPNQFGYLRDGIFFFSDGETRYVLENDRKDTPVYFGGHFQLLGARRDYVVHVHFSVFNAIGYPPPGNGPTANDIGVVSFSSANPNANMFRQANLDSDRAFVLKAVFGYRFWDTLWGFLSVSHRDGQPFTFFETHEDRGQVAVVPRQTRGSPFKYTKPFTGPREDFRLNVDLQVEVTFGPPDVRLRATALVANLLDFGNELAERSFHDTGRPALEEQLPRSLIFFLEWVGDEL